MSVKREIFSVGFDKNGEAEFGVCADICNLDYDQMKELRAMIPVAIGVAEDMWRRHQEKHIAVSG